MSIELPARVSRREEFFGTMVGEQQVLLDIESGVYVGLDPIGSHIWSRLETPIAVEALCADLAAAYEADLETITRDVLVFLDRLAKQKMIEVAS
ncbi:MAG: PqqD family protein [Caulobacter sp.]|nr:PqqD family protein [Caulobacter sp.]